VARPDAGEGSFGSGEVADGYTGGLIPVHSPIVAPQWRWDMHTPCCLALMVVVLAKAGTQGKRMKSLGSRFRGNDELKLFRHKLQFSDSLLRGA
jgi:hypothetical protein